MEQATYYHYRSPYGVLSIAGNGQAITQLAFGAQDLGGAFTAHALTNRASTQVLEYLAGKRQSFDVALQPAGTAFQRKVWDGLRKLDFGEFVTVSELAHRLGLDASYRMVGAAVKKNPLPILIPSHRIVTAQGKPAETGAIPQALWNLERTQKEPR